MLVAVDIEVRGYPHIIDPDFPIVIDFGTASTPGVAVPVVAVADLQPQLCGAST